MAAWSAVLTKNTRPIWLGGKVTISTTDVHHGQSRSTCASCIHLEDKASRPAALMDLTKVTNLLRRMAAKKTRLHGPHCWDNSFISLIVFALGHCVSWSCFLVFFIFGARFSAFNNADKFLPFTESIFHVGAGRQIINKCIRKIISNSSWRLWRRYGDVKEMKTWQWVAGQESRFRKRAFLAETWLRRKSQQGQDLTGKYARQCEYQVQRHES